MNYLKLYKFVKENLPTYSIFNVVEQIDDMDGNLIDVPLLLIKPNHFKSSSGRAELKINKDTNQIEVKKTDLKRIIGDYSVYYGDDCELLLSKFKQNNTSYLKIIELINLVVEQSYPYKSYKELNVKANLNAFSKYVKELTVSRYYHQEGVSAYFPYDICGGISASGMKSCFDGYFQVLRDTFITENLEIAEMYELIFPLRYGEDFKLFITNDNGEDKIYCLLNKKYVQLHSEQEIKDYAKSVFFNNYKQSIFYKFDADITEIDEKYFTLLEMDNI